MIKSRPGHSWPPRKNNQGMARARPATRKRNQGMARARPAPRKKNQGMARARPAPRKENQGMARARPAPRKKIRAWPLAASYTPIFACPDFYLGQISGCSEIWAQGWSPATGYPQETPWNPPELQNTQRELNMRPRVDSIPSLETMVSVTNHQEIRCPLWKLWFL